MAKRVSVCASPQAPLCIRWNVLARRKKVAMKNLWWHSNVVYQYENLQKVEILLFREMIPIELKQMEWCNQGNYSLAMT